jgi:hypothetical protein
MHPSSWARSRGARQAAAAIRARNGTAYSVAAYTDPWCQMLPNSAHRLTGGLGLPGGNGAQQPGHVLVTANYASKG